MCILHSFFNVECFNVHVVGQHEIRLFCFNAIPKVNTVEMAYNSKVLKRSYIFQQCFLFFKKKCQEWIFWFNAYFKKIKY